MIMVFIMSLIMILKMVVWGSREKYQFMSSNIYYYDGFSI